MNDQNESLSQISAHIFSLDWMKEYDWSKATFSKVLFRLSYVGTNYRGIAYQDEVVPTVELELYKALFLTKLIKSKDDCDFSRCGRTDAGVHAARNYFCVLARDVDDPCKMLNGVLPRDIRILGCRKVPKSFDCRYNCFRRTYRYFLPIHQGYNVQLFNTGASQLVGTHDFRNYCKPDVVNQKSFVRTIYTSSCRVTNGGTVLMYEISANGFLWHMVRSIVYVLSLVASGVEDESLVSDLLNVEKVKAKPIYELADPNGLILYECDFAETRIKSADGKSHPSPAELSDLSAAFMKTFVPTSSCVNGVSCNLGLARTNLAVTECVFESAIRDLCPMSAGTKEVNSSALLPEPYTSSKKRRHTKLLDRGVGPSIEEKRILVHEKRKRKLDAKSEKSSAGDSQDNNLSDVE